MNIYRYNSTVNQLFWIVVAPDEVSANTAMVKNCLDQSFDLDPSFFELSYTQPMPVEAQTVVLGINAQDDDFEGHPSVQR